MTMPKVIEKQPDLPGLWLRLSSRNLHFLLDLYNAQRMYGKNLYRLQHTLRARASKNSRVVWTEEKWGVAPDWKQRGKIEEEYEPDIQKYHRHVDDTTEELKRLLQDLCATWIKGEQLSNQRAGVQMSTTYIQQALHRCFQDVQDFIRNPPPPTP